ncbi:MAG: hypothetical protein HY710_03825 [Candidatus Latescibacteria bacterium]|nr:hypothetical protein [Candidatus Latescibacterota bacterium]
MRPIDYAQHNAEVKAIWDAYYKREPIRVPIILGINPRYTMFDDETNPDRISFTAYSTDSLVMLERQLIHQDWIRHHIPQDMEMGPPQNGWAVYVDFQNYYEAAWLGCDVHHYQGQVPDTAPLLQDDTNKHRLFDQGIPDPFEGGLMRRNWAFFDYFKQKQAGGYTYKGLPIASVAPAGLGTDGPLTVACNLRGTTEFMTDLLADPGYARALLDYITEATIVRITAYRQRLGLPLKTPEWGFADDALQLISTDLYESLILPFHRRLVETFSEGGPNSIHLCGDATRHFGFLRGALNIQSFDTGFPIDFAWVRDQVGPDVEIRGGPSVMLLQTGSPAQVRAEVRRVLSSGVMRGGRFILREANNLPPGVPVENLWAMYETGKEYGQYE